MAAKEGKYYLICNYEKYDGIANYRIDRICELKLLDEKIRPFESLPPSGGQRLNLEEYMRRHIYMFSSEDIRVEFRIPKRFISDIIDMFGKGVRFSDETGEHVTVTANVSEMAMEKFATSFTPHVTVLKPKRLADRIKRELQEALRNYDDV